MTENRAKFTQMKDGDADDYSIIAASNAKDYDHLADKVIDHFENPKNVGSFDKDADDVGTGLVGAPECGDVMKLDLKMDGDTIEDVKFKTYGCGSAIASSTMFVEMLKGKTIEQAKLIKDKEIADALELPPIKLHCSVLAEEGIKKAIENWEEKSSYRKHNNPPV